MINRGSATQNNTVIRSAIARPRGRSFHTINKFLRFGLLTTGAAFSVAALISSGTLNSFMTLTFLSVSCLLLFVLSIPNDRGSSVVKCFFAALVVFHFGLLPEYMLIEHGLMLGSGHGFISLEIYSRPAIQACIAFILAFTLAVITIRTRLGTRVFGSRRSVKSANSGLIGQVALISLILSVGAWFLLVMGVIRPQNYLDYIMFFERNPALGNLIGILHTAIAATFFLACIHANKLMVPLIIFGIWALFSFPIGLRGEVLFPIALTAPVLMSQGQIRIHWTAVALAILVVLFVSAAVANSRIGEQLSDSLVSASPLEAISELGGSLRPSFEVEKWLQNGDEYRWGATYYAPFERTLQRILPFADRIPAEEDHRLMNVLIMQRAGPFGFSIVAEAVINFGILGAFAVGGIAGAGVSVSGSRLAAGIQPLIYASILFGALVHIRQSFVSAFGATVVFLLMSMAVIIVAAVMRKTNQ